MKTLSYLFLTSLLLSSAAVAEPHWRFSAGYAPMIGLKAEFKGFGNFNNPFPVAPPAPGTPYVYSNGSVLVDSSGNLGGLTNFWSYNSAAQFDPAAFGGQGAINYATLGSSVNQAGSAAESNLAAAAGFELRAELHLGSVAFLPSIAGRESGWGVHFGYQYARVDVTNMDSLSASMTTVNDSFNLGGVIPPLAPFAGTFLGPGPLLGDTPVRTLGTANADISGIRNLEVNLSILQFGSYLEIPVTQKLDVMLEGGFLLGIATGDYDYTSTVTVPGFAPQTTSGSASRTRVLPGFYAGLGLRCPITQRLSLQASARYQFMRQFDIIANGSDASLNFDSAFVLSLAAVWKF